MDTEEFDAIIIGAGQAGPSLAGRLNDAGWSVAIIERHLVGGTCVNTGCKPTKTLVASAYAAHTARRGSEYGFAFPGNLSVDMSAVAARAKKVITESRAGNETWLESMAGVELVRGHARFVSDHEVTVGERILSARHIFINVGGRANVPEMDGLHDVPFLTNSDMVSLQEVPDHLVVIGGSYIGLEFAQMYRRFGAQVTVVERAERLIPREDPEISQEVRSILEAEAISIITGAQKLSFAQHESRTLIDIGDDRSTLHASHLLVAVGRRPNTDDLGLDAAGIATDERGFIKVNEHLETGIEGVFALGDCNGRGAFTHTAYNDFEIVAANLLDVDNRSVEQRLPAYALYIDPPRGRVGMTEAQARSKGYDILTAARPMTRGRTCRRKG